MTVDRPFLVLEKQKINGYADTIASNIRRVERCHVKITLRLNQPNRSGLEPYAMKDAKNKFVNLWRDCPVPKGGGYLKRSENLRAFESRPWPC